MCVSGVFVREWLQELRGLFNSPLPLAHEAKRVGGLWSQISVDKGIHSSQCKDLKTLFNTAWKAEQEGVTGCGSQQCSGWNQSTISRGLVTREIQSSASLPCRDVCSGHQSGFLLYWVQLCSSQTGFGFRIVVAAWNVMCPGLWEAGLIIQTSLLIWDTVNHTGGLCSECSSPWPCGSGQHCPGLPRYRTDNSRTRGFRLCGSEMEWLGCGCFWPRWVFRRMVRFFWRGSHMVQGR